MAHENVATKVRYFSKIPICPQTKNTKINLKFYSMYLGYITLVVPTQLNNLRDEPMSLRYCEK